MNQETIKELEELLKKEQLALKKQLQTFAVEDPNLKGNWATKSLNAEDTDMEEKADEVQEYDNLLSLEHSLELKLKDVDAALEKVSIGGGYGICEKCDKEIEEKRLMVCPEARLCMGCNG